MNTYDILTTILIVGTGVVWIVWDVVLGAKGQATESMWIAGWSRRWSAFPFTMGALMAHWFMQSTNPNYEAWPVAVALLGAVLAWDVSRFWWRAPAWMTYPGIWLVLGMPVGFFFWPQRFVP